MSDLAAARKAVYDNLYTGSTCPCCDQYAKQYWRGIHAAIAAWLCCLVRRYEEEPRWYSVSEGWGLRINKGTGDTAKLRFWDLVERAPKDPNDRKRRTSGLWRPTPTGIDFVHQCIKLPKQMLVYNNTVYRSRGGPISIVDALKNKFDYRKLMGGEQ